VELRELSVKGSWEITPKQWGDPRGVFLEWFKAAEFADHIGHELDLVQANMSVSAAGVVRGVHFADVPPGQAKYVTCPVGAVLDVVVDLRVGSPTFGTWDSVLLDDTTRRAIYLPEGVGHAFCSLQDDSVVTYLCSEGYAPQREHGIHPLDPELAIQWPTVGRDGSPLEPALSAKDAEAPSFREAQDQGLLPLAADVEAYVQSLRERPRRR
jgi:dTDP-4-dehydrorhamnose 3,5-epimerase